MEEKRVVMVKTQTSMRGPDFLSVHRLTLYKKGDYPWSRYEVYQESPVSKNRFRIGLTFRECSVWIFVPDMMRNHPDQWYFGTTRYDAIAGYLKSNGLYHSGLAPSEEVSE